MIVNLHTPTHSTSMPHTNTVCPKSAPTPTPSHITPHTPTQTVPYSTFYPLHQTPRDNGGQDLPGIQEGGADDRRSYTEHDSGEEKRSYKY